MPKRIPKAFARGYRKVSRNPGATFGILIGLIVAITFVGLRGEDTREVTNRIVQVSPCTAAPASVECQRTKRESDRERSLRDTCIPFKRALTVRAYRHATRCPHRREVVAQNSPTASQPSGPGEGPSTGHVPDVPDRTPVTDPGPGPNPSPPPSPNPSPPSPPAPSPPAPSPPAPNRPVQITAPGVDVGVGNGGACVGVGGLNVNLGNC